MQQSEKLEISIGNWQLAFIVAFVSILLIIGMVAAYDPAGSGGTPSIMGHSIDEIDWNQSMPFSYFDIQGGEGLKTWAITTSDLGYHGGPDWGSTLRVYADVSIEPLDPIYQGTVSCEHPPCREASGDLYVSGNVSIGTMSPDHTLQIGDSTGAVSMSLRGPDNNAESSSLAFEDNGGTGIQWFKIYHDTSGNTLNVRSQEKDSIMTFERVSGNVGIGTMSPTSKLHVVGDLNVSGYVRFGTSSFFYDPINDILSVGALKLTSPGAPQDCNIVTDLDGNFICGFELGLWTNDSSGNIYYNLGNVGIGTAIPSQKLDVDGQIHATGDICTDADGGVCLSTAGGTGGIGGSGTINYIPRWNGTMSLTNSVIYETGGNVGIGTAGPSAKLEVAGDLEIDNLEDRDGSDFFDGNCSDNQHVTGISSTGAISCAADSGDIAGITTAAGSGLDGGCISGTCTLTADCNDILGHACGSDDDTWITTQTCSAGQYLTSVGKTTKVCSTGDNLGNHIATQNIQLNGYWLSRDGGNEGVFVESDGDVGIGTNNPGINRLEVVGGPIKATGGLVVETRFTLPIGQPSSPQVGDMWIV